MYFALSMSGLFDFIANVVSPQPAKCLNDIDIDDENKHSTPKKNSRTKKKGKKKTSKVNSGVYGLKNTSLYQMYESDDSSDNASNHVTNHNNSNNCRDNEPSDIAVVNDKVNRNTNQKNLGSIIMMISFSANFIKVIMQSWMLMIQ